jgi:hypothetical protein
MDRVYNTTGKWKNKIFLNQKIGYKNVKIKTLKTILKCRSSNVGPQMSESSNVGPQMSESSNVDPQLSVLKWRSSIVGPQMTVLNCRSSNAGPQVSHHPFFYEHLSFKYLNIREIQL